MLHSLEEVPAFASEDEERDWWAIHDLSEALYDELQPTLRRVTELLALSARADGAVEVTVAGPPPVYGAAQSLFSPKRPHAGRVALLRKKAEEAMGGRPPLQRNVVMVVSQVYRKGAMADAANIVGAISNALEGIVYANDQLVRQVHFVSKEGRRSLYKIKVIPLP